MDDVITLYFKDHLGIICEKLIEEGKMPNIDHLYEFLDSCVEVFGEEYIKVMNHIGITNLVRSEWLFKGNLNRDV
jgi:hypothetical protein